MNEIGLFLFTYVPVVSPFWTTSSRTFFDKKTSFLFSDVLFTRFIFPEFYWLKIINYNQSLISNSYFDSGTSISIPCFTSSSDPFPAIIHI